MAVGQDGLRRFDQFNRLRVFARDIPRMAFWIFPDIGFLFYGC